MTQLLLIHTKETKSFVTQVFFFGSAINPPTARDNEYRRYHDGQEAAVKLGKSHPVHRELALTVSK